MVKNFWNKIWGSIKKIWSKHKTLCICFLSSLPLVVFGVVAMILLYTPTLEWQKTYNYILTPIFVIIYIAIVEFATVVLPLLLLKKAAKKQTTTETATSSSNLPNIETTNK
jgi:hypothetical protein